MNDANLKYQIIHDIVSADDNVLNIKELCEITGVSRSGYYAWIHAESKRNEREAQDQRDFELILAAFQHRGYDKGVRGIYMRLLHNGIVMNQKNPQINAQIQLNLPC